jgi:hypothetical protein
MNRFAGLNSHEKQQIADAVWLRQRNFIAGDRMFQEYGDLLNELLQDMDYVPGRFR